MPIFSEEVLKFASNSLPFCTWDVTFLPSIELEQLLQELNLLMTTAK